MLEANSRNSLHPRTSIQLIQRRRIRRMATLVSSVIALGALQFSVTDSVFSSAMAQERAHDGHAAHQPQDVFIDGALQPDLIPNEVAIRALMQTLRIEPNPDSTSLRRVQARVSRANLSQEDMEVLVRELGAFDAPARAQRARIDAVRPEPPDASLREIETFMQEHKNFDALVVAHYERLLESLSPEGATKMQEHLRHIKSRIRIYPTPNMSGELN